MFEKWYIKRITVKEACRCNRIWHSSLPKIVESNIYRNKRHVCYGLFHVGVCYGISIWTSPVARGLDDTTTIELRRMALRSGAPHNSASWMISKMVKDIHTLFPEVTRLVSYQDTDIHSGTIYKASNWIPVSVTVFSPWNKSRKRNKPQTTSNKVRWEYYIE